LGKGQRGGGGGDLQIEEFEEMVGRVVDSELRDFTIY
jgi:hypothetical protein